MTGGPHQEARGALGAEPAPLLALVGLPGAGKTAVRRELMRLFGPRIISAGPDEAGKWSAIFKVLDALPQVPAIVEMCRFPQWGWYERAQRRGAYYVELRAPATIREERLRQRGEPPERVTELMALDDSQLEGPDLRLETAGRGVEAIATEIYEAFQAWPHDAPWGGSPLASRKIGPAITASRNVCNAQATVFGGL